MLIPAVLLVLAPAADLSDGAKKELKALEGEWTIVAVATGGKERELPPAEQIAVSVKGRRFTFGKFGDAEVTALDPTLSPKILDFKMLRKPESGVINEMIYKLDGETLTVAVYLGEGKKRPDSFEVPEGTDTQRYTLKRPR